MTDSERIEKLFSDREKSAQQARASANRKRLLMAGLGTLGIIGATGLVMYLGAKEQYGILLGIFSGISGFLFGLGVSRKRRNPNLSQDG